MKISEIPKDLKCDLLRDGEFESLGFASHRYSKMLVFLESEKYLPLVLANPEITCVITTAALVEKVPAHCGVTVADNPRIAFYSFHNHLAEQTEFYWKDFNTEIAQSARVHPRAVVAEKNVRIGERCVIGANVTIHEHVILEDDVIVGANTVLGAQGFQFLQHQGHVMPVAHGGGVLLRRNVEIQSSTVVDKSVFGSSTTVGEESKVDNLVHLAHDCKIGKRNRIVAHAMIGGSVETGDDVWIGPSAVISHEIKIGEGASVSLGAVVTRNVPAGARVSGNFAIEHSRFLTFIKSIR
jgi:UDP-3-O-[3-hydroxymyristoyl] glucosamine N-acyltransferase